MARPSAAPAAQLPTLRGAKPKAVATERKQKSLGRLAERFLHAYCTETCTFIRIDEAATALGAERRRIYDLFNICEAVGLMFRRCVNEYAWAGSHAIAHSLSRLQVSQRVATRGSDGRSGARKPRAAPSPLDPPPPPTRKDTPTPGSDGRSAGRSGRRNNATPPSANRAVGDAPLHIPIGDGATALRIDFGAQSAPARRPNSLCALTQRFVAFFLDHHPYQTMERVGACIVAECQQQGLNAKTRERRLYDVANVLCELRLVQRIKIGHRTTVLAWRGEKGIAELIADVSSATDLSSPEGTDPVVGGGATAASLLGPPPEPLCKPFSAQGLPPVSVIAASEATAQQEESPTAVQAASDALATPVLPPPPPLAPVPTAAGTTRRRPRLSSGEGEPLLSDSAARKRARRAHSGGTIVDPSRQQLPPPPPPPRSPPHNQQQQQQRTRQLMSRTPPTLRRHVPLKAAAQRVLWPHEQQQARGRESDVLTAIAAAARVCQEAADASITSNATSNATNANHANASVSIDATSTSIAGDAGAMHSLLQLAQASAANGPANLSADGACRVLGPSAAQLARQLAPPGGAGRLSAAAFGARLLSLAHGAVAAYTQWLGEE